MKPYPPSQVINCLVIISKSCQRCLSIFTGKPCSYSINKEGEKFTCKHCSKDGHDEEHCWKLHPERRPKKFGNKGKPNTAATIQHDLGSDSGDETKITTMGYQGKGSIASTSSSSNSNLNKTRQEKESI
jgi:hypothetical protein